MFFLKKKKATEQICDLAERFKRGKETYLALSNLPPLVRSRRWRTKGILISIFSGVKRFMEEPYRMRRRISSGRVTPRANKTVRNGLPGQSGDGFGVRLLHQGGYDYYDTGRNGRPGVKRRSRRPGEFSLQTEALAMASAVGNNPAKKRFEVEANGALAFLEYELEEGAITLVHTEVPPELEGQGLAGKIVKAALAYAESRGLKVIPRCPFVAGYIARHKEFEHLTQ
ncbi:MAG: GNAT family N-acetyltransferase [Desulfuromonadales bacterium]